MFKKVKAIFNELIVQLGIGILLLVVVAAYSLYLAFFFIAMSILMFFYVVEVASIKIADAVSQALRSLK